MVADEFGEIWASIETCYLRCSASGVKSKTCCSVRLSSAHLIGVQKVRWDSGRYNHWTRLRSIDSHDLTRVRPILDATHESSTYRILEHIIPLRGVTLVAAQETIVKALLPERREHARFSGARRPERTSSEIFEL